MSTQMHTEGASSLAQDIENQNLPDHGRTSENHTRLAEASSRTDIERTPALLSSDVPAAHMKDPVRRPAILPPLRSLGSRRVLPSESLELSALGSNAETTHRKDGGRDVVNVRSIREAPRTSSDRRDNVDSVDSAEAVTAQTPAQERSALVHFFALLWCIFVMGWNDGTTGPMLPRIQENYHVTFAVVSLIFVSNTIGFVGGAFANVYLTDRFGFGKVLVAGSFIQVAAYGMIIPAGPFPLLCVAFVFIGFGLSMQHAHCNSYVAAVKHHTRTKLGFLHGVYGLGALVAPLVATQFAKSASHWSFHYLVSAGLYITNCISLWFVFRGRSQREILAEEGEPGMEEEGAVLTKYKQILSNRDVHFFALFALIYVGTEVTVGGWIVTYILQKRHGTSSSGYIASGFFGGMTVGRLLLMWFTKLVGERRVLYLYLLLAISLEITVWVVPSLIENAIAVAFVGVSLGPLYPILMRHSTTVLPRWLLVGCMGYIASIGQAGSAVLPFLMGVLASKFGIASLQPFVVSMMSSLMVIWAIIPRSRYVPT
ncbi:MFS general substrate transporter [Trametes cingulata]|nr:MFS general substrate transporter [Trametes cingulata]